MKKVFLLLVFFYAVVFAQDSPVIESKSTLTFDKTIETIKESAEKDGWKVLIVHNLQESLRKNGQEVLPVSVIELCKPAFSGAILKNDEPRLLSVFMPCRVSVYEKTNGDVYISRMNAGILENPSFDKDAAEIMSNASEGIEKIIAEVISR